MSIAWLDASCTHPRHFALLNASCHLAVLNASCTYPRNSSPQYFFPRVTELYLAKNSSERSCGNRDSMYPCSCGSPRPTIFLYIYLWTRNVLVSNDFANSIHPIQESVAWSIYEKVFSFFVCWYLLNQTSIDWMWKCSVVNNGGIFERVAWSGSKLNTWLEPNHQHFGLNKIGFLWTAQHWS